LEFVTLEEPINEEAKMPGQPLFDEINQKLKDIFQHSPAKDLEKNLRAMLQGVFSRLDLVTREEFDVQSEVLARTREKLSQLEARIDELEGAAKRESKESPPPIPGNEL
jgi:ubiquinone biosynthesis accessory factor UbiK